MKRIILASLLAVSVCAAPAFAGNGIKVGVLSCDVSAGVGMIIGSSKAVSCTFKGSGGRVERYEGRIGKLGVDIGATGAASMAWLVFAPGKLKRGSLQGSYNGASAQATVIAGLGANVLVGGFEKSINLQPLSVQGQTGLQRRRRTGQPVARTRWIEGESIGAARAAPFFHSKKQSAVRSASDTPMNRSEIPSAMVNTASPVSASSSIAA